MNYIFHYKRSSLKIIIDYLLLFFVLFLFFEYSFIKNVPAFSYKTVINYLIMLFIVCYLVINTFFPKKRFTGKVLKKKIEHQFSRHSWQRYRYELILDNKKTIYVPLNVYAVIEVGDEVTVQTNFISNDIESLDTKFKKFRDIHQLQLKLEKELNEIAWRRRNIILMLLILAIIIFLILR